ncbi:4-hydroxybenzoate transporter PcaK [Paraburkholderia ribeironis]|uniref:4-hydroxybenzoate transporter PcaK n=1 Tax=Paraburkholderia ribeironis TaxID=1247936 RepID=A0A1N7RT82_9BURK|nr:MFS transporter [Paraburkholderia ribeironis]SIT38325.1 4-hydroxybenzoate transporter PcaK [Paraburkholderia ribeironis]
MSQAFERARTIDVHAFIDAQRFSLFHCILFVLCFLAIALDGLDTGAMGLIAPTLAQDWHVARESLGPVMSASLIGIGVGALLVSPIADRVGRRIVLICAVACFGVWSCAAAFASSMEMLTVMRFLTGVGLGAAIPNTATLMAEFVPARMRGLVVNAMLMGFAAGNAVGGVLSGWLIPAFGWRSLLLVGGVAPLVLACLLLAFLPESVKFMVSSGRPAERIARILRRLSPSARLDGCVFVSEAHAPVEKAKRSPVFELFSRNYAVGTVMLWVAYFMCLVVLYLINNWMPTLLKSSGFSLHQYATTAAYFHLGASVGIVVTGWLMDRISPVRVIAMFYALTALVVFIIGRNVAHDAGLTLLIVATGLTLSGAASSMSTLATQFYPTTSRVTGGAWMLAIGRLGAVAGTFGGAFLLSLNWEFSAIFGMLAVPSLIAAGALLVLGRHAPHLGRGERMAGTPAAAQH